MTESSLTLTLSQRSALDACLRRPDGRIVLPAKMSLAKRLRICETLQEMGLVQPVVGQPDPWPLTGEACMSYIVTEFGRKAAGHPQVQNDDDSAPADQPELSEAGHDLADNPPDVASSDGPATPAPMIRQGSKLMNVVEFLARPGGASIAELAALTRWLPHTTRAALTGLRRRGFGLVRSSQSLDHATTDCWTQPSLGQGKPILLD